ncbi:MAG: cobalamin biosynthesis protein CobD [Clostridia bacterium]|nr:cobalamin biosynthesis protein CobD [Clostridia bacterium]
MIQILIGYCTDLVVGDPYFLFHPVRWIGNLIAFLEKYLNQGTPSKRKIKGIILVLIVTSISFFVPFMLLILAFKIHLLLGIMLESFMIFQIMATKSLDFETKKVYKALLAKDIVLARKEMSYLVSRDTHQMSEEDIVKAGIETISENLADGVISPLIFIILGGGPLGWLYKSINTMDSMVGYKNERYENFGWAAAKLDDLVNYVPARLTSLFILIAGFFLRLDIKNGIRILKRDRRNHSSPNSAYPESAVAGLLRIQLGGKATYFGKTSLKPTMGDAIKPIEISDMKKTSNILYLTSLVAFVVLMSIKYGVVI